MTGAFFLCTVIRHMMEEVSQILYVRYKLHNETIKEKLVSICSQSSFSSNFPLISANIIGERSQCLVETPSVALRSSVFMELLDHPFVSYGRLHFFHWCTWLPFPLFPSPVISIRILSCPTLLLDQISDSFLFCSVSVRWWEIFRDDLILKIFV